MTGPAPGRTEDPPWHALSITAALDSLAATEHGLTSPEVARRQAIHGLNELPQRQRDSALVVFVRQFGNPLICILLAAGVVSVAIGNLTDAGFIFGVLTINALIGGIQEPKPAPRRCIP